MGLEMMDVEAFFQKATGSYLRLTPVKQIVGVRMMLTCHILKHLNA